MTTEEVYAELARIAPNVAFTAKRKIDRNYQWDGDGPDPVEDGFDAYDVIVTATAVVGGKKITGRGVLGGSYYKPDEPLDDAHGYLLQMLQEAANELKDQISVVFPAFDELTKVIAFLSVEMRSRYVAQRTEFAKNKA